MVDICAQVATLVYEALLELGGGGGADDGLCDREELQRTVTSTVGRTTRNAELDKNPSGKPWNVEVRTVPALYQRFRDRNTGILSLISSYGVLRTFSSACELAKCCIPVIETACLQRGLARYVQVQSPSGIICLVTPLRACVLLELGGRLPCPFCPMWCKGEKGLWWHVQEQHKQGHQVAVEQVQKQREELAMVVYNAEEQQSLENLLLSHNIRPPPSNDDDNDDPWEQVKRGDLAAFQTSVAQGKIHPATALDRRGASPLLWAAGAGHLELVRFLIDNCHCDPEVGQKGRRAFQGRTALHWAARKGHTAVVQYLLGECHVNLCAMTKDGTTAFHWAAWQAHHDVLRVFVQAAKGNTDIVVCHVNTYGCNAALWAAQGEGTVETMEWLESVGCPIQLVNHSGHGILHKAAQRGRKDVCEWFVARHLLSTNNESDAAWGELALKLIGPDNDGCMPSDLAGMEGHQELAIFLARQEQALVIQTFGVNGTKGSAKPSWFSRAAVPSNDKIWEPWAGVARLRHACQL